MATEKEFAELGPRQTVANLDASPAQPIIRKIGPVDLMDALAKGFDDFKVMPSHVVFLIILYPILMFVLARLAFNYETLPLVFPILSGFALIGPVVAIGLYEVSRRRELGLDFSWVKAFRVVLSPSIISIVVLGIWLMAIYFAWLYAAMAVYEQTFGGMTPASIAEFVRLVLTTSAGQTLIFVGCGIGFLFAVVVLSISAVSFPMLLDQDVGVMTAVQTSIKAVVANPITMALWGLIVAGALVIGSLPFFVGLAVVLPVLGHSTWHLYRKVVVRHSD